MPIPSNSHHAHPRSKHSHGHWKKAAQRTKHMSDPWHKFHIDENFPDEMAIRHRYNARKKTWVKDEVHVRMEQEVRMLLRLAVRVLAIAHYTLSEFVEKKMHFINCHLWGGA